MILLTSGAAPVPFAPSPTAAPPLVQVKATTSQWPLARPWTACIPHPSPPLQCPSHTGLCFPLAHSSLRTCARAVLSAWNRLGWFSKWKYKKPSWICTSGKQIILNNYVPNIVMDIFTWKNYSFLTWNSNLPGCHIFYLSALPGMLRLRYLGA